MFQDENPVAPAKIKVLKQMIEDRFPVSQGRLKTGSHQDQGPQADDRGQVPGKSGRLKTGFRQDHTHPVTHPPTLPHLPFRYHNFVANTPCSSGAQLP